MKYQILSTNIVIVAEGDSVESMQQFIQDNKKHPTGHYILKLDYPNEPDSLFFDLDKIDDSWWVITAYFSQLANNEHIMDFMPLLALPGADREGFIDGKNELLMPAHLQTLLPEFRRLSTPNSPVVAMEESKPLSQASSSSSSASNAASSSAQAYTTEVALLDVNVPWPNCFLDPTGQLWTKPRILPDGSHVNASSEDEYYALTREGAKGCDKAGIPYVLDIPLKKLEELYREKWDQYKKDPNEKEYYKSMQKLIEDPHELFIDAVTFEPLLSIQQIVVNEKESEDQSPLEVRVEDISFIVFNADALTSQTCLLADAKAIQSNIIYAGEEFKPINHAYMSGLQALVTIPTYYNQSIQNTLQKSSETVHEVEEQLEITQEIHSDIQEYAYYMMKEREIKSYQDGLASLLNNHRYIKPLRLQLNQIAPSKQWEIEAQIKAMEQKILHEFQKDPDLESKDKQLIARYHQDAKLWEDQHKEAIHNMERLQNKYQRLIKGQSLAQRAQNITLEEDYQPINSPDFQKDSADFLRIYEAMEITRAMVVKLRATKHNRCADVLDSDVLPILKRERDLLEIKYSASNTVKIQLRPSQELLNRAHKEAESIIQSLFNCDVGLPDNKILYTVWLVFNHISSAKNSPLSWNEIDYQRFIQVLTSAQNRSNEQITTSQDIQLEVREFLRQTMQGSAIDFESYQAQETENLATRSRYMSSSAKEQRMQQVVDLAQSYTAEITQEIQRRLVNISSASPVSKANFMNPDYNYMFKIAVIGDENSGKSSLLLRYTDNLFTESHIASLGVDSKTKTINQAGYKVVLQLFEPKDRYLSLRGASAILLCVDLTNKESIKRARSYIQTIRNSANQGVPCIIVATKCDLVLEGQGAISSIDFRELCLKTQNPGVGVSAKTGANIEAPFAIATAAIMAHKQYEPQNIATAKPNANEQKSSMHAIFDSFFGKASEGAAPQPISTAKPKPIASSSSSSGSSAQHARNISPDQHSKPQLSSAIQTYSTGIQKDIAQMLATSKAAVAEAEPDYRFKIMIVGASGVGKSCLLLRYADNIYTESFISTIGVDFKTKKIEQNGKTISLQIWDTAGQERFRTAPMGRHKSADAVIICFDLTDRSSFINVRNWLIETERALSFGAKYIIVATKYDKAKSPEAEVSIEEFMKFCNEIGHIGVCVSAKNNTNVDMPFSCASAVVLASKMPSNQKEATPPSASSSSSSQGRSLFQSVRNIFGSKDKDEPSKSDRSEPKPK